MSLNPANHAGAAQFVIDALRRSDPPAEESRTIENGGIPTLAEAVLGALTSLNVPDSELEDAVVSTISRLNDLGENWEAKDVRRVLETEPLDAQLRRSRHLLIEGDPGSGKTTALKRIAMALVRARLGDAFIARSMGFSEPFPYPLFVSLTKFASAASDVLAAHEQGAERSFVDYLAEEYGAWIIEGLRQGKVCVLLDGLDEVVDHTKRIVVAYMLRSLVITHRDVCRFIVTSRPSGLSHAVGNQLVQVAELQSARIAELGPAERRRFAVAWYRAVEPDRATADRGAKDLLRGIQASRSLSGLIDTPVLLTAMAIVHKSTGQLPARRARLYDDCIQALVCTFDEYRGVKSLLEADRRLFVVSKLAFDHFGQTGNTVERAALLQEVGEQVRYRRLGRGQPNPSETEIREAASQIVDRTGLFVQASEVHYRFRHLAFMEFLAARWIAVEHDEAALVLSQHLMHSAWREVILLYIGLLARDGSRPALLPMSRLIQVAAGLPSHDERAFAFATISRAILDLATYPRFERVEEAVRSSFVPPAVALLDDRALPGSFSDRVAVGDAVGLLGDPRLSEAQRWVQVPKGRFWRGAAPGDAGATSREGPSGWVMLSAAFQIKRAPVLVCEYSDFVTSGGYEDKRWWQPEGWEWRVNGSVVGPLDWERQWLRRTRPVVGVSWWEASAYATWLNKVEYLEGGHIRLPTEAEWERSARGGERDANPKRVYPWGDEWDPRLAHSNESGILEAAPVGLHPTGNSPSGAWDMAGNVWEWCQDSYARYQAEEDIDPVNIGHSVRVIRGGAWGFGATSLRVSCRLGQDSSNRFLFLGFRVALLRRDADSKSASVDTEASETEDSDAAESVSRES